MLVHNNLHLYILIRIILSGSEACERLPQETHVMLMALHGILCGVGVYQIHLPFRHLAAYAARWAIAFVSKRGAWVCSTTYFNPARFGTTHVTSLPLIFALHPPGAVAVVERTEVQSET